MAAKFFCLGCDQTVKPSQVSFNVWREGDQPVRFHENPGHCGPLVWLTPELETTPSRDQVLGSLRRAAYVAFGHEKGEILLRAVEKGWKP